MKLVLYGHDGAVKVLDGSVMGSTTPGSSRYLEIPSMHQAPPRWDNYIDGVTPPDFSVTIRKRTFVFVGRGQRAVYYEEVP